MNSEKFFNNKDCPYFPCHEVKEPETFNCLFCYCPLYALGRDCGGKFVYLEDSGIKDCSGCLLPHSEQAYDYIQQKIGELIRQVAEAPEEKAD